MKKLLSLVIFLTFCTTQAQLQEGNFMLGTDLGNGVVSPTSNGLLGITVGLDDSSGWDIGLSPKFGYMINDNFLLGGIVNLGYSEVNDDSDGVFVYGVQALSKYYISPQDVEVDNIVPAGRFFVETNAGIAGRNVSGGDTTNGFAFGFGPGYSYFATESIALEASLKYSGLVGAGNDDFQHAIGLNLGIQIFFPRSDAENAVDNFN